jgi:NAD(P)-dependent dehydrogenase (short-subunit alcohol dehydrogenase family)
MSKVFFLTGSSRGLGRQIAVAALDAGHRLVATARKPEQLEELVRQYGDRVRTIALDVSDTRAAERAVAEAVRAFGRIDVLVNNAGYANLGSIEDTPAADFLAQVETNFLGVVNVTRAALPVLRAQRSGHVIQISSVGGRMATAGLGAYQASKWAVGGFSLVLASEVAPLGIRVTVLEPGGMATDWAGSSMKVHPIGEAYRPTVGRMAALHDSLAKSSASDPAKVARVVLQVAEMPDPPLRLLLGSDALRYATAAERAQLESDERNAALSRSTDRDDADQRSLDPMAAHR